MLYALKGSVNLSGRIFCPSAIPALILAGAQDYYLLDEFDIFLWSEVILLSYFNIADVEAKYLTCKPEVN